MKNLWPDKFEENKLPSARQLLEEQAKLLAKITEGVVDAEVEELTGLEAATAVGGRNEFVYRFTLIGRFINNYKFHVMAFAHDITLYPVVFRFEETLGKELGAATYPFERRAETPAEAETIIGAVLQSARVRNVIGSIMRLSK